MVISTYDRQHSPPAFAEARSLRQKACAAGFDPSYWYAVEWETALAPGKVIEVKLWDISVALYRDQEGQVHAVENRCAHRHVKLSKGFVEGCNLKCVYHGWTYDGTGKLVGVQPDLFGKSFPSVTLRVFPTKARYGLIWVFFGDPVLADLRHIPEIVELNGPEPWLCVPLDFKWRAHPTMIINNFMDSTHVETIHNRRFHTRTLKIGPVTRCHSEDERVIVSYDIDVEPRGLFRFIGNELTVRSQDNCYDYPYLWASVGEIYKLWTFMLPVDDSTTRVFFLSLSAKVKITFTPWFAPRWMHGALLPLIKRFFVAPLFAGDGWSSEIEQEGYEKHFDLPAIDLHPAPNLCYQFTVQKWEEHLSRRLIGSR